MSETYKLEDGKKYRLISVPQHWSLIEYWTRRRPIEQSLHSPHLLTSDEGYPHR